MATTVQIQSVSHTKENIKTIERTLVSVANAIRVAREFYGLQLDVVFAYGDANEIPSFTFSDIELLKMSAAKELSFDYRLLDRGTGFARGHNTLFSTAESHFIMTINPGMILSPDFFTHILNMFDAPQTAIVEARKTPVETSKMYDTDTLEIDYASMDCAVISNTVLEEVGGLDEAFYRRGYDVDFSLRAKMGGYRVKYQPLSLVHCPAELSPNGKLVCTDEDSYYTVLDDMLLAYKWASTQEVNSLLRRFALSANKEEQRAVTDFKRLKSENLLPSRVSTKDLSRFKNALYCKQRFKWPVEKRSMEA